MNPGDIPLFSMLKGRLGYLTERQKLISENVANADTAGFKPQDLKPFNFQAQVQAASSGAAAQAMTQPGHMAGRHSKTGAAAGLKAVRTADSETTLDGNAVVLEDQMIKMTQARTDYEAAIGFYQKSMNLLRMAARSPGR